jgi:hypothetical protein
LQIEKKREKGRTETEREVLVVEEISQKRNYSRRNILKSYARRLLREGVLRMVSSRTENKNPHISKYVEVINT